MSCRPVWNNFVLRYAQGGDNVLRVVLSAMYSSGWVGMGFSKDGMMVGSSAMVGWVGKTGLANVKQFALNGKSPALVVAGRGFLVSNDGDHTIVVKQAKIYLAFQLRFQVPLKQQQVLLAFGSGIPVNERLAEHQDKTSITFDFTTVGRAGNSWKIGYGFNLAILLITIITLEVLVWTRWRNNSSSTTTYQGLYDQLGS